MLADNLGFVPPPAPLDLWDDQPRSYADVIRELNVRLKDLIADIGEDFSCAAWGKEKEAMPKSWRWISCYAVRGGSEGYYVHVDLIFSPEGSEQDGRRQMIGLCKCWSWDDAFRMANAATRVLHGEDVWARYRVIP